MSRTADESAMQQAIALGRGALGRTWPNPAVGCVIALGGATLAWAATAPGGRPHAEEQALIQAGEAARGATAYVSLEPCGERTSGAASCAERLAQAGMARVVYAADNPDPRSLGRGPARLRAAGVIVEPGFLADAAAPIYASFVAWLATGRARAEAASGPQGYDAPFERQGGESLEAALLRHGAQGHARVWTQAGGADAAALSAAGLISPNALEVLR